MATTPDLLFLEPSRAAEIESSLLPHLDGLRDRPGVTVVKSNRIRTVLRVPLPGGAAYVKLHPVRGLSSRLKYLVVPSRARAEWRVASAMRAAGLPVPRVLFALERRRGGILGAGALAVEEVPGAEDLVPWLERRAPMDGDAGRRRALLADIVRLVRRMHDAGFDHRDLHGGNLLVSEEDGKPRVTLIDLHTVRIRRRIGRRARLANLGNLFFSFASVASAPDLLRLLRAYEGDAPVLGAERAAWGALSSRIRAFERRRHRSRTRRCLGTTSSFVREKVDGGLIFRRRSFPAEEVKRAVGAHREAIAAGGPPVLKDSGRSAISRVAGVVVKETRLLDPGDLVKNAFRRPRGRAAWVNGNGLAVRGFGSAEPLALLERGRWPLRRGSFLLMEDQAGRGRLDLFVLKRYAGELTPERRREKVEFVRAFGRFVRRLHRAGVYHGDLKAVNVFVDPRPGAAPAFFLVDYDRVGFLRRVSRRRRIKNLAQIAASVAVLVTRTDRLRFYRAWAPDEDAIRAEKAYNRGVERALRRKIVVRMHPIE